MKTLWNALHEEAVLQRGPEREMRDGQEGLKCELESPHKDRKSLLEDLV